MYGHKFDDPGQGPRPGPVLPLAQLQMHFNLEFIKCNSLALGWAFLRGMRLLCGPLAAAPTFVILRIRSAHPIPTTTTHNQARVCVGGVWAGPFLGSGCGCTMCADPLNRWISLSTFLIYFCCPEFQSLAFQVFHTVSL